MKILILGSISFAKEMKNIESKLKSLGHEARLPEFSDEYLKLDSPDKMHEAAVNNKLSHDLYKKYYQLIQENEAIFILNEAKKGIDSYIGANTLIEMAFAHILNRRIYLYNGIPQMDYTDEIKALNTIQLNQDLTKIPK